MIANICWCFFCAKHHLHTIYIHSFDSHCTLDDASEGLTVSKWQSQDLIPVSLAVTTAPSCLWALPLWQWPACPFTAVSEFSQLLFLLLFSLSASAFEFSELPQRAGRAVGNSRLAQHGVSTQAVGSASRQRVLPAACERSSGGASPGHLACCLWPSWCSWQERSSVGACFLLEDNSELWADFSRTSVRLVIPCSLLLSLFSFLPSCFS